LPPSGATCAAERQKYEDILERAVAEAADKAAPNQGATELVAFLREHRVPMAIITRNTGAMVERSLLRMEGMGPLDFDAIVSRDLPLDPKPSPDGVFHAAEELGVKVGELLVIGDHAFDIEAGRRAGSLTMLVRNGSEEPTAQGRADFVVDDLAEAPRIIRYGLPLPVGTRRSPTLFRVRSRSA
jgi:HAD superfamily hydrolase (TIGR01549 family)